VRELTKSLLREAPVLALRVSRLTLGAGGPGKDLASGPLSVLVRCDVATRELAKVGTRLDPLPQLQIGGGHFAVLLDLGLVFERLSLPKLGQARPLDRRNMHEDIGAAAIRGDEPVALLGVKPFDCAGGHDDMSPSGLPSEVSHKRAGNSAWQSGNSPGRSRPTPVDLGKNRQTANTGRALLVDDMPASVCPEASRPVEGLVGAVDGGVAIILAALG
jgi:hypothetical protein